MTSDQSPPAQMERCYEKGAMLQSPRYNLACQDGPVSHQLRMPPALRSRLDTPRIHPRLKFRQLDERKRCDGNKPKNPPVAASVRWPVPKTNARHAVARGFS